MFFSTCASFAKRRGQPLLSIRRAWVKARDAAGCQLKRPHDFRRSGGRNILRSGVTESVAMKITGHVTRSMFERYNITSDGDLREAARRMSNRYNMVTLGTASAEKNARTAEIPSEISRARSSAG